MSFELYVINVLLITAALLVGQQLVLFDGGILFLGSAAFYAFGGYISATLAKFAGISPLLSIIIASFVTGGIAITLGYPLLRSLKQDYFALATLGITQAGFVILRSTAPGGNAGMAGIPELHSPLQFLISPSLDSLLLNGIFVAICFLLVSWIRNRRLGALILACRFDENALSTLGYRPILLKVQVLAISGLLAGAAGAMLAHYVGAIDPRMSSVQQAVLILCGTILSGRKSVFGALLGASFLVVLPEILQRLFTQELGTEWQIFSAVQIGYGVLILAVALIMFPKLHSALRSDLEGT